MAKPCSDCNSTSHTRFQCPLRRKPLRTRKPMNRVGRVGRETARAVAKWKQTVKPNHQGYYTCYLCGVEIDYLLAEHVKGRARHPDQRTNPENLRPACNDCNQNKGSKEVEEL